MPAFIPWQELIQAGHWSPSIFCGPAALIHRGTVERLQLGTFAKCFEGWRVSSTLGSWGYDVRIEDAPIYRPGNVGTMRFHLEKEHWQAPKLEEEWCVERGDVVINKTAPLRAALVTSLLHRHPVDGNCFLIRPHKPSPLAAWVALCLNQSSYEAHLLGCGGAVVPRVTLGALQQLPIPQPPLAALGPIQEFAVWNDLVLENEEVFGRLAMEVEAYVQEQLPSPSWEFSGRLTPGQFFPADTVDDSLLPFHVENSYLQRELRDWGWIPLVELLSETGVSRTRLTVVPEKALFLRLRDVKEGLMIGLQELEETMPTMFRVFKQPVGVGEVLVSLLVTSPKVAYVGHTLEMTTYLTDNFERVIFRETPGAWALMLNTSPIQAQLRSLAMGSVQQFARAEDIQQIHVPAIGQEVRQRWHTTLTRYQQRKKELEHQGKLLWKQALAIFAEVHGGNIPVEGGRL